MGTQGFPNVKYSKVYKKMSSDPDYYINVQSEGLIQLVVELLCHQAVTLSSY